MPSHQPPATEADATTAYELQTVVTATCSETWVVRLADTERGTTTDELEEALLMNVDSPGALLLEKTTEHQEDREIVRGPKRLTDGEERFRVPLGTRLTLTASQLAALGECVDAEVEEPAECVLLDHTELTRAGLDLPRGTIELRQGDAFVAIAPDGDAIESTCPAAGPSRRRMPTGAPCQRHEGAQPVDTLAVLTANATEDELRLITSILARANDKPAVIVTTRDGRRYVVAQEDEPMFEPLIGLKAPELHERVQRSLTPFGARWLRRYGCVDEMYRSLSISEVTKVATADRARVWGR
jgi:hypothetical protein